MAAVKAAGYRYVTLDLEGFRSGNLNAALGLISSRRAATVVGVLVADIHHVSLNVADTERSLDFYCGVLGMAKLPRPDFSFGGAWLDAGNGHQIHLIEAERAGQPRAARRLPGRRRRST